MKNMDIPRGQLEARIKPKSYDPETRSLTVVWGTGADVMRRDIWGEAFVERLSMDKGAVNLDRLRSGRAPLLRDHQSDNIDSVLGVVTSARIEDGVGTAEVRLSARESIADIVEDVRSGILSQVSVGYTVEQYQHTERSDGPDLFEATRWTPHEVSLVPVAADGAAHVRNQPAQTARVERTMEDHATSDEPTTTPDATPETENEETTPETEGGTAAPPPLPAAEPAPAPESGERSVDALVRRALADERTRAAGIRRAVRAARLPDTVADDMVTAGTSLTRAREQIIDRLADADDLTDTRGGGASATASGDTDALVRDAADSMLARSGVIRGDKLTARGREFASMRMFDLGKIMLQRAGGNTQGGDVALVKRMISTSDFPAAVARVAERALLNAYAEVPRTFEALSRMVTVSNFAPIERARMSGAPELLLVPEGGEIQKGPLGGELETFRLHTYARRVALTRQAIVNDDLNTLARLPAAFGAKAREMENRMFYQLLESNPVMSDGNAFFSAAHGNLMTASAINLAGMTAARAAMRGQKDAQGNAIYVTPAYLVCGPAQEAAAEQFLYPQGLVYTTPTDAVPPSWRSLQLIVDPNITDDAWYLWAQPGGVDTFEHAYLGASAAGVSGPGPQVDSQPGFEILGVDTRCVHDFGVGAIDWVGVVKTPGS